MSSPEFMQQVIQSNPMLQQMVQQNPQLQQMLSNPAMLQQMMNPQAINAAMQMMQGGAGPGVGAMGGGAGSMLTIYLIVQLLLYLAKQRSSAASFCCHMANRSRIFD